MKFDIILEKEEDETFSVHCPVLKGCHSQGNTKEEALLNIRETIDLYLETVKEIALHTTSRQSGCSLVEITV
jgi:predicted RNase H-like HicB family nuclease